VDVALAALSLDLGLEVYFTGDAIFQLARQVDGAPALMPGGYRAWSALPELGALRVFAEAAWLDRMQRQGVDLVLPVEGLDCTQMARRWRRCRQVMVL
jgi:sulfur relay (sulfurtransferase) DsrF/TusC family protein